MTPNNRLNTALPLLPTLPLEDVVPDNPEGCLRLTVAFDILSTETRRIMVEPDILERLTQAMLGLRDPAQALQEAPMLVELARGPVGRARTRLRTGLDQVRGEGPSATGRAQRSIDPIARIHHLLALIDQAAELLVRRETLYIQSKARPVVAKA